MRSPPSPALQNVLVARPGTNSNAVIRRDDLVATAVLAADGRDTRKRSVLSVVHRRWARFSESLRRRRGSSAASQAAAALAATDAPFRATERSDVVAAFDRQRVRQADKDEPTPPTHDDRLIEPADIRDDVSAASSRDNVNSRRLRQFGAREDDDTLLMLPRVASVSLSSPENEPRSLRNAPRVRRLPRVSAWMPTRAPRPLAPVSPVSSDGQDSVSEASGERSDGNYSDEYESRESHGFSDEDEEDEELEANRRHVLHRLPTGLTNVDVERAMEKAVVEITSDGDSDSGSAPETAPARPHDVKAELLTESGLPSASKAVPDALEEKQPQEEQSSGEDRAGEVPISASLRSRSEAHQANRPRQNTNDNQVIAAFSRRISSSTHTYSKRRLLSENDSHAVGTADHKAEHKIRFHKPHDYALFEDDYLSFQGFHGQPDSRSHHQSMGSLLRSRRISSITDSHSEGSDENSAIKPVASTDTPRRMAKKPSILSNMFWSRRGNTLT